MYIFNNTFYYPDNNKKAFIDLLKGRVKNVFVNIEIMKNTDGLIGNYLEDKEFKHQFTLKVRDLWEEKDAVIENMKSEYQKLEKK